MPAHSTRPWSLGPRPPFIPCRQGCMACPTAFLVKDPSRGIGWTSLMINRKPTYASWGSWLRPQRGSADEQFVIDRCTTLQLYTARKEWWHFTQISLAERPSPQDPPHWSLSWLCLSALEAGCRWFETGTGHRESLSQPSVKPGAVAVSGRSLRELWAIPRPAASAACWTSMWVRDAGIAPRWSAWSGGLPAPLPTHRRLL